jgi:hypothetical protein
MRANARLVQEEPVQALDAERAGQLASIGIVKGQPFAPDDRMRAILEQAAQIGAGMARVIAFAPRDPEATLDGSWKNAFVGGSYEFLRNGARLLDARTQFHYIATVITPAMAHAQVGAGISDPRRRQVGSATGARRSRARPGFSYSGSTARCSPGSIRPGSSTSSNPSADHSPGPQRTHRQIAAA